jgi:hypothetical protein
MVGERNTSDQEIVIKRIDVLERCAKDVTHGTG